MNRRTWVATLGAAAALVLALASCGDDDAGDADQAPTKTQFIAKADAICRETKAAQASFTKKVEALPDRTDIKRVAPLLEGALGESRKGLERLRALPAPKEDGELLDKYFEAADRLLEAHKRLADAAKASDRPASQQVAAATQALSEDERQRGGDYGLNDCNSVF